MLCYGKTCRHFLAISLANVCCDFNSSQLRRCEFGSHRLFFGYDTIEFSPSAVPTSIYKQSSWGVCLKLIYGPRRIDE